MHEKSNVLDKAEAVLKLNNRGSYTVPGAKLYPHQWLWDSCFIAIGLSHIDTERAKIELLSLFRAQWSNGMLPHIIFSNDQKYERDRQNWKSWLNPYAPPGISTSGITQPPVIAEAVVSIGKRLDWPERRSWYKSVWPALLAYHQWLYRERDPHEEGLVLQIHPWETGLDNTPPWMSELHAHLMPTWIRFIQSAHLSSALSLFRRDRKSSIPITERLSTVEALSLFSAQHRMRRKAYDIDKVLDHSLFIIEDLSFNSILVRANQHLTHIAKSIRTEVPTDLEEKMKKSETSFEQLWDPYGSQYFSRDFITHRLLKEPSIAALMPLYAGCITKERAATIVRMLEDEHLFGTPFPVPSVPVNSSWFNENSFWQGPSWINTNWFIIDGLKRYGYFDHAAALTDVSIELTEKAGFYEYFNPLNGIGLGSPDFSWTAALIIDLLKTADGKKYLKGLSV